MPHFLFYRNGEMREAVVGPNVPVLEKALRAHLPRAGEPPDDLSVRAVAADTQLHTLQPSGADMRPLSQLNRFRPPPEPPRPTTANSRPRTADLLKQGRVSTSASGSRAGSDVIPAAPKTPAEAVVANPHPVVGAVEEEA